MFVRFTNGHVLILLIYVDDIILTGDFDTHIHEFIDVLCKTFAMKDLGLLHYFLGMEVTHHKQGLLLTQSKYIVQLLHDYGFDGAKPVSTPLSGLRLSKADGELLSDPIEFRQLVGALQYLTMTRPDISYVVNSVCQFMQTPRIPHLLAAKRILRYLKDTPQHGLLFTRSTSFTLTGYSHADWAECPNTRRSTCKDLPQ